MHDGVGEQEMIENQGFVREFGIVEPSWISKPLDAGTYQVLCDGYKVVLKKKGTLKI